MHQDHNLHWDAVAQHFEFIRMNKKITPTCTDLFARNLPNQASSLAHFSRTFARTLCEFSTTERAKYPAKFGISATGKLFPDALLSPDSSDYTYRYLTPENQNIGYWIKRATKPDKVYYSTADGDLADAVKVLLAANALGPLLTLANHADVPLRDLRYLSWGHSFGVDHVAYWAVISYIFFNIALAVLTSSELERGFLVEMKSYDYMVKTVTMWGDCDAQSLPHRDFFCQKQEGGDGDSIENARDPLADMAALREYLKMCWALLYRYDMLMRECGLQVDWETAVIEAVTALWPSVKTQWVPGDGKTAGIFRFI